MALLHESLDTHLSLDEAFAFVADFANAARWDPGTVASERVGDGPVGVGARYRLQVRMGGRTAPMDYRIVTYEPPHRVVLVGEGSNVSARDEIRFDRSPGGGTHVDYRADIRLGGWMRLLAPFAGAALRRIGRDARAGMQQALDARAQTPGAAA